jgi:aspartate/methionine/tyrosine aminotransferase
MELEPFKLERYFAKYEFNARYLLSSSDCDGFSLDYVLAAAEHGELDFWNNLSLGYTDSQGHPLLREAISRHYNTINRDEVFVLSPGEANYILMQICLKPGDDVVCMRPAYQSLYQVAVSIDCKMHWWEPDDNGRFNPDDLKQLVTENTRMIIINFPHNPTGYYPSKDELQQIIAIASKYNTLLFSDEMYHKLVHNVSYLNDSLCDLYDNTISLWGTSKSFGLGGVRIGWVATHNHQLLKKMQQWKDYLTICSSAPSEIITMIALNNSEQFIEVNLKKIRNNKLIFKDFVSRHGDIFPHYRETEAGSTAFVKVNLKVPTLQYTEEVVKETRVMLVPAEMFEYGSSHLRIGFGRANFAEALAVWENYINLVVL